MNSIHIKSCSVIRAFILISLSFALACTAKKSDNNDTSKSPSLDLEISASADSRGLAKISFQTAKNATKLMISARSKGGYDLRFTKVNGGGVNYLTPNGDSISFADSYVAFVNAINVPSRSIDTPLSGETSFDVEVQVDLSSSRNDTDEVTFYITSREDSNFGSGGLDLNIFYVGDIGAENETKSAMQAALSEAKDILSNAGSISVNVNEFDISGPVSLPYPADGNSFYRSAASSASSPAVNVFVGGDIDGGSSFGELLGVSASIPGPATPTEKSAVAISIFSSAGRDGIFDNEDIRILGETIAHESSHFMGLFHPVDLNGSIVAGTDPLTDTESCSFLTDCVSRDSLIHNLMFPSPVADGDGSYVRQNRLTDDQKGVLNRYVAVR